MSLVNETDWSYEYQTVSEQDAMKIALAKSQEDVQVSSNSIIILPFLSNY